MFSKLSNSFSNALKKISQKELNEKNINEILTELEFSLLESDVALEVIDSIKDNLKKHLTGTLVDKKHVSQFIKDQLIHDISLLFDNAGSIDIVQQIKESSKQNIPYVILFVGINGTGKTTTLAKFAHLLAQNNLSVVMAAADTFRAGAIEQLREHANRLNLKLVAQNYDSDPAAVARDAVLYAQSHKTDCVLVDSAGRMQTSTNLMDQIRKITKVVNPNIKIFVGDSLAGNDATSQAKTFHDATNFDCSILTKCDADSRGGAALSIVHTTSTPIVYLGVGQGYSDLKPFDKHVFLDTIFATQDSTSILKPESIQHTDKNNESNYTEYSNENQPQSTKSNTSDIKNIQIDKIPDPNPIDSKLDVDIKPKNIADTRQHKKDTVESKSDPFEGILTDDINSFIESNNISPPQNDQEAQKLASDIKKWFAQKNTSEKKKKFSLSEMFKK